jgi:hypothetical protein
MRKIISLLLLIPLICQAQTPVQISQPYNFTKYVTIQKYLHVADSINADSLRTGNLWVSPKRFSNGIMRYNGFSYVPFTSFNTHSWYYGSTYGDIKWDGNLWSTGYLFSDNDTVPVWPDVRTWVNSQGFLKTYTETEPLFSNSVAYNIKASDTTRWGSTKDYTFSNGLTENSNNVSLGGDIIQSTYLILRNQSDFFITDSAQGGPYMEWSPGLNNPLLSLGYTYPIDNYGSQNTVTFMPKKSSFTSMTTYHRCDIDLDTSGLHYIYSGLPDTSQWGDNNLITKKWVLDRLPKNNIFQWDGINKWYGLYPTSQPGRFDNSSTIPTDITNTCNWNGEFYASSIKVIRSSSFAIKGTSTSGYGIGGESLNGIAGNFIQTGIPTSNISNNVLNINRNQTTGTAYNITGNILQLTDNPATTGTISGSLIKGITGTTERLRMDPRVKGNADSTAYIYDTNRLLYSTDTLISFKNYGSNKFQILYDGSVMSKNYGLFAGRIGISTTTPMHKFSMLVNQLTTDTAFNIVNTDRNKQRRNAKEATDTSSISAVYTKTGKPVIKVMSNIGDTTMLLDSIGNMNIKGELKYKKRQCILNSNTEITPNLLNGIPQKLLPGMTVIDTIGIGYTGGDSIKITSPGDYNLRIYGSISGIAGTNFYIKCRINNVDISTSYWRGTTTGNSNYNPNIGFEWYLRKLTGTNYISFWITNPSNDNDATIGYLKVILEKQPDY